MFLDEAKISVVAGKGGDGAVAWRREKYVPKGGPFGGCGGQGGSIYLQVDVRYSSLDHLSFQKIFAAEKGAPGGTSNCTGRNGTDLYIYIPPGTLVKDPGTQAEFCDLMRPGETFLLAKGGRGGRGNASFKSAKRRSPNWATPGLSGESHEVLLQLKLIADIGLVGLPNAGKSTLLRALTGAKAKVGAYPFTTKYPNIGALTLPGGRQLLLADIPGIVKDAHKNRGLGLRFLRHIERTRLLFYLLDASSPAPLKDLEILRYELAQRQLDQRPYRILITKSDLADPAPLLEKLPGSVALSAASHPEESAERLAPLLEELAREREHFYASVA